MRPVIEPDEVADLLKRLAEAGGVAAQMRRQLAAVNGPLATLAALRIETVQGQIDSAVELLAAGAQVIVSVSDES